MKERKQKIAVICSICLLFLLIYSVKIPAKSSQDLWEISWSGEGAMPYFRSSAVLEIRLKKGNLPKQVKVFVNHQQQEISWKYEKTAEIYFGKEGIYNICIEHENGVMENQRIYVEFNAPETPVIETGFYESNTWTSKTVKIMANGSKAVSGIEGYEYKIGESAWKKMEHHTVELKENMKDVVSVRAVSKAGSVGSIKSITVKIWKKQPKHAKIIYEKADKDGWYSKIPTISYQKEELQGPDVTEYFRLLNVRTKESYTMKNEIPQIKKDGIYQLSEWCVDEAGNRSETIQTYYFKIDSTRPEISVDFKKKFSGKRICRQQKAEIQIWDENLKENQIKIETGGRVTSQWIRQKKIYKITVDFQKEGMQYLKISAQDAAGNSIKWEEDKFEIDRSKPKITVRGIKNYESYQNKVKPMIEIEDKNRDTAGENIVLNGKPWTPSPIYKEGRYCLKITAEDAAGNQSEKKLYFTVNKTGIKIQWIQKKIIGKEIRGKNFKPKFLVKSIEPVQVRKFLVNGKKTPYIWEGNIVKTKAPIKENGRYEVQIFLIDAAGNQAESNQISFIYDTKKTDILVTGVDGRKHCVYGTKIRIHTKKKEDILSSVILDGNSLEIKENEIKIKCTELGVHTLVLTAKDTAGNISKKSMKFTVDKVMPRIAETTDKKEPILSENEEWKFWTGFFIIFGIVLTLRIKKRK